MPELPDVEVFRRYVGSTSLHQKIKSVRAEGGRVQQGVSSKRLRSALEGHQFRQALRHGKYLFVELTTDSFLLLHFGMTGFLKYYKSEDQTPEHAKLLIDFSNGYHLAYDNQRKLGRISIVDDPEKFIEAKGFGPDPLSDDFDIQDFNGALKDRKGSIKSALMNQQAIAGIGNIYSDEILFQAGIRPDSRCEKLNDPDRKKAYAAMLRVLRVAVRHEAKPNELPGTYLLPHRKDGERCPRCGGLIHKKRISGRSSYYCGSHQRLLR